MALSKLAVRRLTKLAEYMESLPREANQHFNMNTWVQHAGSERAVIGSHGIKNVSDIRAPVLLECGMKACALGWGCSIPSFRKAGLRWALRSHLWGSGRAPVPTYKSTENMSAARAFFDLSASDTDYMFRDVDATTPKQWAKACRKFIQANT